MTPIEQKIQAAIEAGSGEWTSDPQSIEGIPRYVYPLVMAVLKPLLDDARGLAEIVRPNTKSRTVQDFCERIHAAIEPGPGADSSPVCANCGRTRGDHNSPSTCPQFATVSQLAEIQKRAASVPPGPVYDYGSIVGGARCVLPQGHAGHHLVGFVDTEQSRQAAAGVPDNNGGRTKRLFYPCEIDRHDVCGVETPIAVCTCPCHAKKQPHPLGVYGVDWVMTKFVGHISRYLYRNGFRALKWSYAGGAWMGVSSGQTISEIKLTEPEALAFLAEHPIPPDLLKLAAIPTITGSADAMKTPGLSAPWAADIAELNSQLERMSVLLVHASERIAALEKGKVAT